MNYSTGSTCAIALLVSVVLSLAGTAVAQDEARFPGSHPVAYTGEVTGWIIFVDPNGTVSPTFPYWGDSYLINGTNAPVTFYQSLTVFDNSGGVLTGFTQTLTVPALTAVPSWLVSDWTTQPIGLYSVEGTMGYLDASWGAHELDEQVEDFMVIRTGN